ncbi:phosphoribosyltransferase [Candidatus Woesearchaeota archaeon]|nr:phosphoribosyltransferase [Candidatus Woesearchaeota archaeon]
MHFKDRHEAGIKLAEQLKKYKENKEVIVLAIPRGGVEVGYEIAKFLNARLDIIVTKKIGLPGNEEFAIGSVGPDKKVALNEETIRIYNVSDEYISRQKKEISKEIERRYKAYRGKYELQNLKNKIIILTDDGIATGFTTKAAITYIKSQKPKKLVLAVPVAPADFASEIKKEVELVCIHSTNLFFSISQFYDSFPQLEDEEVKKYLKEINK